MGDALMVYTRPKGSQFVILYPFRVPTDIHLGGCGEAGKGLWVKHVGGLTYVKSWLKLAKSMLGLTRSAMTATRRVRARRRRQLRPVLVAAQGVVVVGLVA